MISDGSWQCPHRALCVAIQLALCDALGLVWVCFCLALNLHDSFKVFLLHRSFACYYVTLPPAA